MTPTSALNQARDVLDSIRRIVRALRLSSRATEKASGLSSAQLFVLQKLKSEQGLSVNELAERTLTHQSSVSVVVGRLVELGLVQRRASSEDRRRLELKLTRKGQQTLEEGHEAIQDRMIGALLEMPAARREALMELLGDFVERAGLSGGVPPLFFEDHHNRQEKS